MRNATTLFGASAIALGLACSSNGGNGQLSVHLTDAPGPYDHVDVDIVEVSVHRAGGASDSAQNGANGANAANATNATNAKGGDTTAGANDGADAWITIPIAKQTIDLLTLQNGQELALGATTLPAGSYDMIRLVVDSATVTVNGTTSPLTIPSGSERGVQISHPFTIAPNDNHQLLVDFDAQASVHLEGNGTYSMRPVLAVKRDLAGQ